MTLGSPLAAYARFQARDALLKALTPVGLFLVLGGLPLYTLARRSTLAAMREPGMLQDGAIRIYGEVMTLAMTLGAIVLMSGLASLDRERGHFRFLFSRPVAPWRFYLQHFLIATVLFVACFALLPVGFGAVIAAVPVLPAVQSAALYALMYGSLAFLCSALLNRDGLVFILVMIVSRVLQQLDRAEQLSGFLSGLANALPPLQALDGIRASWLADRALTGNDLVLVIGYSLGMLVAALVLIRQKSLAR